MAVTIGSNILSQTVQRNLSRSSESLSTASERLSSGQRINKASDDAAGLSISMSLDKDRILARTAQRNISDGISMISIMGAGLSSQKEILFRMAELSEQSANGTYSNQQRSVLQKEYSSLMDEFDRIGESAEFNGIKLLRNRNGETVQLMAGITGADTSLLQVAAVNSHRYAGVVGILGDSNNDNRINTTDIGVLRAINYLSASPVVSNNTALLERAQNFASVTTKNSDGTESQIRFMLFRESGADVPPFTLGTPGQELPLVNGSIRYSAMNVSDGEIATTSTYSFGSYNRSSLDFSITYASGVTTSLAIDVSSLQAASRDWQRTVRDSAIGFTNIETSSIRGSHYRPY